MVVSKHSLINVYVAGKYISLLTCIISKKIIIQYQGTTQSKQKQKKTLNILGNQIELFCGELSRE